MKKFSNKLKSYNLDYKIICNILKVTGPTVKRWLLDINEPHKYIQSGIFKALDEYVKGNK